MSDNNVPVVNVTVGDTTYPAGVPLPKDVADLVTNPKVFGDSGGQDEVKSYGAMKVAELKAYIEARNADRADEDKIPAEGTKAELAAALEADDAAGG